jgi:hypothetical protein
MFEYKYPKHVLMFSYSLSAIALCMETVIIYGIISFPGGATTTVFIWMTPILLFLAYAAVGIPLLYAPIIVFPHKIRKKFMGRTWKEVKLDVNTQFEETFEFEIIGKNTKLMKITDGINDIKVYEDIEGYIEFCEMVTRNSKSQI